MSSRKKRPTSRWGDSLETNVTESTVDFPSTSKHTKAGHHRKQNRNTPPRCSNAATRSEHRFQKQQENKDGQLASRSSSGNHMSYSQQSHPDMSCSSHAEPRSRSRNRNRKKSRNQRYQQPSCTAKNFSRRTHKACEPSARSTMTAQDDHTDDALEIPGFYYDREKKKYFKILPNHSNVSGKITKDVIKSIKVEKQRQKDLEKFSQSKYSKNTIPTSKGKLLSSNNVCHTLMNSRLGAVPSGVTQSLLHKHLIKNLVPRAKESVAQEDSGNNIDRIQDVKRMILSKDSKTVTGVWTLDSILGQRMNQIHMEPVKKVDCDGNLELSITKRVSVSTLSHSKVTSMCWAPRSSEEESSRVLLTTTSYIGDHSNFVRLWDFDNSSQVENFDVGRTLPWSCAWNASSNTFSVGTESSSLVIDVATRSMWELYSNKCPVYAQTFAKTHKQLYTGNRKGQIFIHDLRSLSTLPVSTMVHKLSIADLYLSTDQHHLVVSDVSGTIKKWDLRKMKVIHSYPGHVNAYLRNPLHVDDEEKILYAVGEDCYTRIWCYKTGELLHTIPSPCPVSVNQIPAVAYSHTMGGTGGLPGLLMAVQGHFHFYTY